MMNTVVAVGLKHLLIDNQSCLTTMENHEEIFSRLKFIGHIQKDEKIDVRHVARQPDTLYTKVCRTFLYPDDRNKTLKFIKDVVSRSFEILEYYINHKNISMCKSIVSDLLKAKEGILNLKYTYTEDTKFCCDMDVIFEFIITKISVFRENNQELFEGSSNFEKNEVKSVSKEIKTEKSTEPFKR